jgi:hypothetical protein
MSHRQERRTAQQTDDHTSSGNHIPQRNNPFLTELRMAGAVTGTSRNQKSKPNTVVMGKVLTKLLSFFFFTCHWLAHMQKMPQEGQ